MMQALPRILQRTRQPVHHAFGGLLLAFLIGVSGCGTNRFEQEVETEAAAIKLTGETVLGGYELLSTKDVKQMLDQSEDFLLIDAMPADSFNKGRIPTAVNFAFPKEPLEGWQDKSMEGRKQQDYAQLLGENKERKIVVYCGYVKCARSHNAAICAQELGFTNVYRYPGGVYAWRGAGNTLTTD